MQAAQLQHQQKQEEHTGPHGDEQVLQILQETYSPPRIEVGGRKQNG